MCKRLTVLEAALASHGPSLPVTPSDTPGPAGDILFPFTAPTASRETYTYADDRELLIFAARPPGRKP